MTPPAPPRARPRRLRPWRSRLAIGCSRVLARWRRTTPRTPIARFLKAEWVQVGTDALQWYVLPWCRTRDLDAMQRWLWRFQGYRGPHALEPATLRRPLDRELAESFAGLWTQWHLGFRQRPTLRGLLAGRYSMPMIVLQGVGERPPCPVPTTPPSDPPTPDDPTGRALTEYDAALAQLVTRMLPSLQAAAGVEDRAPWTADLSGGAWSLPRGPGVTESDRVDAADVLWRTLVPAIIERTAVRESPVGQQLYPALVAGDVITQSLVFETLYSLANDQGRATRARRSAAGRRDAPTPASDRLLALAALARWPDLAVHRNATTFALDAEALMADLAGVAAAHPEAVLAILGCAVAPWRAQAMISLVPALSSSEPAVPSPGAPAAPLTPTVSIVSDPLAEIRPSPTVPSAPARGSRSGTG